MMTCSNLSLTAISDGGSQASSETFISDAVRIYFQWIGYSIVCELIDIFGTVSNTINILCFLKMGFKDPVNISLLGLAISDLFCVATLIWSNICLNPAFNEVDLPFMPLQFQYITTAWLHVIFARITSWITAFITLERCLCITAPLKVKSIFTPRRVAVIILCLYIFLLLSSAPVYFVNKLGMVFFPGKNKSILALIGTEDRKPVEKASFAFNNITVPLTAFLVITVCTILLVYKLRIQSKWRETSTTGSQSKMVSNRDKKVVKMVLVISTLFIVCFIPVCIIFIPMAAIPEFSVDGIYRNENTVFVGVGLIMESANSAGNIFIYYFMSSKYKETFQELLSIRKTLHAQF